MSDYRESSSSSSVSTTSTEENDRESFPIFQGTVHAYAHRLLWPDADPAAIVVDSLRGGAYNRIFVATRYPNDGTEPIAHLIRIPRDDTAYLNDGNLELDKDIAVLEFVQQWLPDIPAPRVVRYDLSHGNEFSYKHMVQTFLPGEVIANIYGDIDHKTRCQIAIEVGNVYRQLLSAQSRIPGVPILPAGVGHLRIAPYPDADPRAAISYPDACSTATPTTTPLELITSLFDKRHDDAIERLQPRDPILKSINERHFSVVTMARDMDAAGIFKDVPYSFFHTDLFPRNLLAVVKPKPGHPVLTGVIDWDSARFFPAFMAAKPPIWLWRWAAYASTDSDSDPDSGSASSARYRLDDDDDSDDEAKAGDVPASERDREIKALFEQAAGETYMRYAYGREYWIARKLFTFAYEDRYKTFEPAVAAWEDYKAEKALNGAVGKEKEEETVDVE
ncbi:hypothetical protein QBC34DRAFT_492246 [Podospora aff. communis PSN243]|uniref:Aminoglycoside phosphotransferase domain-containing protein n=1 Tax=Podospora aff. communis PSN243 TaxID=3040156 RepID=A0AAV9GYG9_9PEZI|nr:hypothetical protein QBC34DRAFT_492246 [Podospora aff. communis PSN243]